MLKGRSPRVCETARNGGRRWRLQPDDWVSTFSVHNSSIDAVFVRLFSSAFFALSEQYDPVVPAKKTRFIKLNLYLGPTFDFTEPSIDVGPEPSRQYVQESSSPGRPLPLGQELVEDNHPPIRSDYPHDLPKTRSAIRNNTQDECQHSGIEGVIVKRQVGRVTFHQMDIAAVDGQLRSRSIQHLWADVQSDGGGALRQKMQICARANAHQQYVLTRTELR
jgi:hypothetical protein